MKSIGIGFIGVGDHNVRSHLEPFLGVQSGKFESLNQVTGANIVGLFDANIERSLAIKEQYGLTDTEVFSSQEEMLSSDQIDAVIIGTPDRFHANNMLSAAKYGKHALVEKPLADNLTEFSKVEEALKLFEEKGLIVTSCHPRRFDTPFIWLKKSLKTLVLNYGTVIDITCDFSYHKPSKVGLHTGMIDDHFNHEIDLVNFLFGVESFNARKLFNDETRYNAAGQRSDGISFYFRGTRKLNDSIYPEYFTVRFERADLRIDTKSGICHVNVHDESSTTYPLICGKTDYIERFRGVNQNFIDSILHTDSNYLSYESLRINTLSGLHLTTDGVYEFHKD